MKKVLILSCLALFSMACNQNNQSPAISNVNVNAQAQKANDVPVVSSHSQTAGNVETVPPSKPNSGISASDSSPMTKPIDVAEMTASIEKAEKEFGENQKNGKAKENLAKALFTRAFALTEAAQYRAALGDFRKGLKLSPNDQAAKKMHDEIIRIFESINREPPKEGEEPKPLPFNKQT
ncbi:MAG: tetratricopeptide repeat protein [Acidobacteriota bacterium]|jgi:tetratricopeptide (TPR) repeat protein|nr:tetratricopeptide repeat protein [Acidobacteriota bacterium]